MNIKNQELLTKIAAFPNLFTLTPVLTSSGTFKPVDWSRGIFLEPSIIRGLAEELSNLVNVPYDVVAGVDLSGVPLALAFSQLVGKPAVIVREKPKRLGRSAIIGDVNFLKPGTRVLLIDDLLAGGTTKQDRIETLKVVGTTVSAIAVCIKSTFRVSRYPEHYQQILNSRTWLEQSNIPSYHLITHYELVELQHHFGTIDNELAELLHAVDELDIWDDDLLGYLTKMKNYYKKRGVSLPDYVIEFYKQKGIDINYNI
jgi:orotate phosphoribosyltransferase